MTLNLTPPSHQDSYSQDSQITCCTGFLLKGGGRLEKILFSVTVAKNWWKCHHGSHQGKKQGIPVGPQEDFHLEKIVVGAVAQRMCECEGSESPDIPEVSPVV